MRTHHSSRGNKIATNTNNATEQLLLELRKLGLCNMEESIDNEQYKNVKK